MNVTALPTCQLVMNISMDSFLAFQCLEDQLSQLVGQFRIVGNALFGSIASLSKFGIVVAVPRTALLDDVQFAAQVDDLARTRNTFAEHDVELGFPEWRCHLVLHYLHADLVPFHFISVF